MSGSSFAVGGPIDAYLLQAGGRMPTTLPRAEKVHHSLDSERNLSKSRSIHFKSANERGNLVDLTG